MSNSWQITEQFLNTEAGKAFASLDKVFALQGEKIAKDPLSYVIKVPVGGNNYYVKCYTGAGKGVRRYLGKSRIRFEWENLFFFESQNVPTAEIVAFGEERPFGWFCRGALITKEIKDTADLDCFVRANPEITRQRQWVERVLEQVATATTKLHQAGFAHGDLNWRNILVTTSETPKIFFIDCPSGKRWLKPILRFRILKDLAHLDKVGRQLLSRSQRLRFYKKYTGRSKLTQRDRADIKILLDYYREHRKKKGLE